MNNKGKKHICKNITDEDWATMTTKQLCEKYNVSCRSTINKYAISHNIHRPRAVISSVQNSEGNHYSDITDEDWATLTVSEICRKYKFRISSLYRYIKTHNIVPYRKRKTFIIVDKSRSLKLNIYPNDSDLLVTVKKALKGYTITKLKCLYTDTERDKADYEYVLKHIESESTEKLNPVPFILLLDKITLFNNAKSFLEEYSITRRIK